MSPLAKSIGAAAIEPDKKKPAVVDGKIQYVSATQIQKHRRCRRAWYWRYVARKPDKAPSQGVIRGLEGHKRLEHYFRTGQNVLDPLEQMGLVHLPPFSPVGIAAELKFEEMTTAGFPIVGSIDFVAEDIVRVRVVDYKFKSDVEKWGSLPESLCDSKQDNGVQMLTYGWVLHETRPLPARMTLEHLQFQYRGRRFVKLISVETSPQMAAKAFREGVEPELFEMVKTARETSGLKVLGNEKACRDYGGCPYVRGCFDPMTRLAATMASLRNQGPEGPANEEKQMPLLMDDAPVPAAQIPQATPTAPVTAAKSIVPDDQPKPQKPGMQFEVDGKPVSKEEAIRAAALLGNTTPAAQPEPNPVALAQAEVDKKTRGRKPKVAETPAPVAPSDGVIRVYFDCCPIGIAASSLAPVTQALQDQLIKAAKLNEDGNGISDLRACSDPLLGYNKWKAYLADLASSEFAAGHIPAGHYVVTEGDERVRVVADVIASRVAPLGGVVRSLR